MENESENDYTLLRTIMLISIDSQSEYQLEESIVKKISRYKKCRKSILQNEFVSIVFLIVLFLIYHFTQSSIISLISGLISIPIDMLKIVIQFIFLFVAAFSLRNIISFFRH
jgi:hypothetical protein